MSKDLDLVDEILSNEKPKEESKEVARLQSPQVQSEFIYWTEMASILDSFKHKEANKEVAHIWCLDTSRRVTRTIFWDHLATLGYKQIKAEKPVEKPIEKKDTQTTNVENSKNIVKCDIHPLYKGLRINRNECKKCTIIYKQNKLSGIKEFRNYN